MRLFWGFNAFAVVAVFLFVKFICLTLTSSRFVDLDGESEDASMSYKHDRMEEVSSACKDVLSNASPVTLSREELYSMAKRLSFSNGDWEQDNNGAPLMPFLDGLEKNSSASGFPLNLVSFFVRYFDHTYRSRNYVPVTGFLHLGITLEGLYAKRRRRGSPRFGLWPQHSELSISLKGVYTESKMNGGERVACFLGETTLPSREPDSVHPWEWVKDSGFIRDPPLLQDDQILLVIHYPKTFSLTRRSIRGELISLHQRSNLKYFDKVLISSQLSIEENYKFVSGKIIAKACNPYPYGDRFLNSELDLYKGFDFCSILHRITEYEQSLTVQPNWRCNGRDDFCSKLGPFTTDKDVKATDGGFKDVNILIQYLRCDQENKGIVEKVSAVFRAVHAHENIYTTARRSGVDNMTVSAEGIWKSSSGQLCMVGCPGLPDPEGRNCNSRICLYIPISFSIKQRSVLLGSFSSIINGSYFPLSFQKFLNPSEIWDQFGAAKPYYTYSKINLAGAILEKDEPFTFETIIKKSFLEFPKLETSREYLERFSVLSEDLTLHVSALTEPISHSSKPNVQIMILSLGPLFGRYWSSDNSSSFGNEIPSEYTEKQLLLNVSAQLELSGKEYSNFSTLFLEGIYDQHVGKMYLIGCRDVRVSWKILYESMDLESGLDCLIEVIVAYPPTTSHWLVDPTVQISISSQRNGDDPLYFEPIKLRTYPIIYRSQREGVLSQRGVEGILQIFTLSFAVACTLSQLIYMRTNTDSTAYISLVMLGVQALGYALPLLTGVESMFKKKTSESYANLGSNQWFSMIDYVVKLLVLFSFLLTLRIFQKVWKSRIRISKRASVCQHLSDKWVLLAILIVHATGYVAVFTICSRYSMQRPIETYKFENSSVIPEENGQWIVVLDKYIGFVQDLFLLPQVIGNMIWHVNCKPLRNSYFIGVTLVRLLPHLYDYIQKPFSNPYFSEEHEFVDLHLEFYSKFWDIAILLLVIFLAVFVYIQQKWGYEKLRYFVCFGHHKLLCLGSKAYERLPSKLSETELASGVVEKHDEK